jgi:hypothetical protein
MYKLQHMILKVNGRTKVVHSEMRDVKSAIDKQSKANKKQMGSEIKKGLKEADVLAEKVKKAHENELSSFKKKLNELAKQADTDRGAAFRKIKETDDKLQIKL